MTRIKKWTKAFMMFTAPLLATTSLLTLTSCSSSSEETTSPNDNSSNYPSNNNGPNYPSNNNGPFPPTSHGTIAPDKETLEGTYEIGRRFLSEDVYFYNQGKDIAVTYPDTNKPIVYNWKININTFTTHTTFNWKSQNIEYKEISHTLNNIVLDFDTWWENNHWNFAYYGSLKNNYNQDPWGTAIPLNWENQVFYAGAFGSSAEGFARLILFNGSTYNENSNKNRHIPDIRLIFESPSSLTTSPWLENASEWFEEVKNIHDINSRKMSLIWEDITIFGVPYSTFSNGSITITIK